MRISEAMALGSTRIKPLAGVHLNDDGSQGCAWGMVSVAAAPAEYIKMSSWGQGAFDKFPCNCYAEKEIISGGMSVIEMPYDRRSSISAIIVHLFNDHVMTRNDWTLEQLIAWVRTVEPVPVEPVPVTEVVVEEELVSA